MVLIKICGITNLADARAAIGAGADMLGFNFYAGSPRFIGSQQASDTITALRAESESSAQGITFVGVFVNEQSPETLMNLARETGLDAVQLHGKESVEFCRKLKELGPDLMVIKALRAGDGFQPADATRYETDAIMLDAFHTDLYGGTGQVFDWTLGRRTRELVPRLFLAGGLSPENVNQAIAEVRPYAVDVCSSVELKPGQKDAGRMKAFVDAVRSS